MRTSLVADAGHTLDIAGDAKIQDAAAAISADNGGTIGISGALTGDVQGDLTVTDAVPADASSPVTLGSVSMTANDIAIDNLATSGDATLTAAGSFGAQALAIGGSLHASGTNITIGTATAGIDLSLAGNNSVNLTGDVGAAGANMITAGRLSIGGALSGHDVTLTSSDIAIGSDASVSGNQVSFANNGGGQMFVGDGTGAPSSGAYVLGGSEIARVHAVDLLIDAPAVTQSAGGSPSGAGLVLGSLALTGDDGSVGGSSPNIAGLGSLVRFRSDGGLQLVGKLGFTNFGSGSSVELSADSIAGVLPNAGIALTDADGNPAASRSARTRSPSPASRSPTNSPRR